MPLLSMVLVCSLGLCNWAWSGEARDYFPLQIGNRWVYQDVQVVYNTDGIVSESVLDEDELSVVGTVTADARTYYLLTGTMLGYLGFTWCKAIEAGFSTSCPPGGNALPDITPAPVRRDPATGRLLVRFEKPASPNLQEWVRGEPIDSLTYEQVWYDFTAEEWQSGYPFPCDWYVRYEQGAAMAVPAGSFVDVITYDAQVLLLPSGSAVFESWAPAVGLIKRAVTSRGDESDSTGRVPYVVREWRLREAIVGGRQLPDPTSTISPDTWGQIKTRR